MLDKDAFLTILSTVDGTKGALSEAQTEHASAYKSAEEKFPDIHRKALKFTQSLRRMDEAKRMDYLRSVFRYAAWAGFFDQIDGMSDDAVMRAFAGRPANDRAEDEEQEEGDEFAGDDSLDQGDHLYQEEDGAEPAELSLETESQPRAEGGAEDAEEQAPGWEQGNNGNANDEAALDASGTHYNDGADAARHGLPKTANPHPKSSAANKLWGQGYTKTKLKLGRDMAEAEPASAAVN